MREELGELEVEVARAGEPAPETEPDAAVVHEVGDLLFAVVNLARRLNVDPELALRATNRPLRRRASSGPSSSPRRERRGSWRDARRSRSRTATYELRQGGLE